MNNFPNTLFHLQILTLWTKYFLIFLNYRNITFDRRVSICNDCKHICIFEVHWVHTHPHLYIGHTVFYSFIMPAIHFTLFNTLCFLAYNPASLWWCWLGLPSLLLQKWACDRTFPIRTLISKLSIESGMCWWFYQH